MTEHTIDNEEALRNQLNLIRANGYAMDLMENNNILMCCSAPIFDHTNHVVAFISLSDNDDFQWWYWHNGDSSRFCCHTTD